MSIIASAIVSNEGSVLVARQFLPIPRSKLQGLFDAFVKVAEQNAESSFYDQPSSSYRYIYRRLEKLFVVLICLKTSFLVEDLETLAVLSELLQCKLRPISQTSVKANVFDVIFAMDETIQAGMADQPLSATVVSERLEMFSAEEQREETERLKKEKEASRVLKEKETEYAELRKTKHTGGWGMGRLFGRRKKVSDQEALRRLAAMSGGSGNVASHAESTSAAGSSARRGGRPKGGFGPSESHTEPHTRTEQSPPSEVSSDSEPLKVEAVRHDKPKRGGLSL
eukprot:gnl/Dysnectes_brevis/267_a298_4330.p1 GENE.gnl/Dysnectes_brevis/267_a298_4330~~gnl/Dysnectes_brevis/267_a298_4330.p1  ORF type:complete len:282 (+),score=35.60 gnl/Dysnectes_brevis/267_a298_4330:507-1352(+)